MPRPRSSLSSSSEATNGDAVKAKSAFKPVLALSTVEKRLKSLASILALEETYQTERTNVHSLNERTNGFFKGQVTSMEAQQGRYQKLDDAYELAYGVDFASEPVDWNFLKMSMDSSGDALRSSALVVKKKITKWDSVYKRSNVFIAVSGTRTLASGKGYEDALERTRAALEAENKDANGQRKKKSKRESPAEASDESAVAEGAAADEEEEEELAAGPRAGRKWSPGIDWLAFVLCSTFAVDHFGLNACMVLTPQMTEPTGPSSRAEMRQNSYRREAIERAEKPGRGGKFEEPKTTNIAQGALLNGQLAIYSNLILAVPGMIQAGIYSIEEARSEVARLKVLADEIAVDLKLVLRPTTPISRPVSPVFSEAED
jgi:hypothetical protein